MVDTEASAVPDKKGLDAAEFPDFYSAAGLDLKLQATEANEANILEKKMEELLAFTIPTRHGDYNHSAWSDKIRAWQCDRRPKDARVLYNRMWHDLHKSWVALKERKIDYRD